MKECLNEIIEETIELFDVFTARLSYTHYLTKNEIDSGEELLKLVNVLENENLDCYYPKNEIQNIEKFCNKAKVMVNDIIEEHNYREDLKYDAMMVEKCLQRYNKMAYKD